MSAAGYFGRDLQPESTQIKLISTCWAAKLLSSSAPELGCASFAVASVSTLISVGGGVDGLDPRVANWSIKGL
jgi:hypothetical protein